MAGRRLVVTRAAGQAEELMERLRAAGAEAIALPTIAFAPPSDWAPLDAALAELAHFDGFIFTSANGVRALFARARQRRIGSAPPESAWICALGPATAAALRVQGWEPTIMPTSYVAEGLVAALAGQDLRGRRILLPRAAVARDLVPRSLRDRGATVEVVTAYRTVVPEASWALAARLFPAPPAAPPDAVLLTSSSTAENLARLLGADYRRRLAEVVLASIGPVTSATLRGLGLKPAVEAAEFTSAGLASALAEFFAAEAIRNTSG